jgi:large subunit ribosomal protein L10
MMNLPPVETTHTDELRELARPPRPEKVAEVERLCRILQASDGVFLTDFRGITVARMTMLRNRFRAQGIEYRIVKNNLLKRAAVAAGLGEWIPRLEGPTAVAVCAHDPVAGAKVIRDFQEEYKREAEYLTFKGGLLQGKQIDERGFVRLATLPGREQLVAQLLYLLTYPMRGLVTVLAGVPRKLVLGLEDLRRKRLLES